MRGFLNRTSYYFSRKCDRKHKFSLVRLVEGFFRDKWMFQQMSISIKLMFARARERKNTTLSLPPENKLKNQISTNHTASLVLVFWYIPSERRKCFAWPSLCERRRRERRKFERFRWCFSWNCLKKECQANFLIHHLHVGKCHAKENSKILRLSIIFSKNIINFV